MQEPRAGSGWRLGVDEQPRLMALLLASISQAVIATDAQGHVTVWNHRAQELYGWSAEEALGRSIYDLNVPGPGQDQAREIMAALGRGEAWEGEFTVLRRDGEQFIARVSNVPILDEGARVAGVLGLSEDVTAQRAFEQRAREQEERRAQLLTMASHELRSPLTSILGFARRLLKRANQSTGELAEQREAIELIAAAGERLERSVQFVLKVADLDTGQAELERAPLDLLELVDGELTVMRRRRPEVRFHVEVVGEDFEVNSDAQALSHVVRNLLDNAVKYGGDPPAVWVHLATADDGITLRVTDNGGGVDAEEAPRVFDRYFRGREASAKGPGLGLGLHIAERLVEALGARLSVDSPTGQGATFTLTVPRSAPVEAARQV